MDADTVESTARTVAEEHAELLDEAAKKLYDARKEDVRSRHGTFLGYIKHTYYKVEDEAYCHWSGGTEVIPFELSPGEQRVVDNLESKGLEYLGYGTGRVVFRLPEEDFVVKLARFRSDHSGVLGNYACCSERIPPFRAGVNRVTSRRKPRATAL